MNISVGDLLTFNEQKYMTLEVLNYENKQYAFVNKVTASEEVTDEFYIFEDLGGYIKIIDDDKLRKILLPMFEKMLVTDIEKISEN